MTHSLLLVPVLLACSLSVAAQGSDTQQPSIGHLGDKLSITLRSHKATISVVQGAKMKDGVWGQFDYEYGTVAPKEGNSFLEIKLRLVPHKSREFSYTKLFVILPNGTKLPSTALAPRGPRAWYNIGSITTRLKKGEEETVEAICSLEDRVLADSVLVLEGRRYPVAKFLAK